MTDTATFGPWLQRWALVSDGEPVTTPGSRLLPVLFGDAPAMLEIALDADEQYGNRLMAWWDGDGAAQVLAHHDDGLHAGCLSGVRVFGRTSIANVLHALVAFSTIADWIHGVIYTHQLRHRECFRITDDRPLARIAADRESIMVLGKTRFGGFFFAPRKVQGLLWRVNVW